MGDILLSVGIDLGTTTSQVVFSRLEVENTAGAASVPRIRIVGKEIFYRGGIHFTPLIGRSTIDAPAVREIVENEYARAGVAPGDLAAGAVIITGETARKENSEAVLRTLSGLAGDFVVATAGSDLESIIAGRGAGTAELSRAPGSGNLANLDIGGGTTNMAVFVNGEPADTSCLDIGGRQVILDPASLRLEYVAAKVAVLASRHGLQLKEGGRADPEDLRALCAHLALITAQAMGLEPAGPDLEAFYTSHPLRRRWEFDGLTFSGGVADFIYAPHNPENPFPYGDIGAILGEAFRTCPAFQKIRRLTPLETIRATVVGAGANTMDISGSTIAYSDPGIFPIKNIPILKMSDGDQAEDFKYFASRLAEKVSWYETEDGYQQMAVAFRGIGNPGFDQIKRLTGILLEGLARFLIAHDLLILILDRDMSKALGNSLMNALPGKKIVALDSVKVENGDYIDIGAPLANGRVIPLVIKTLVFGK